MERGDLCVISDGTTLYTPDESYQLYRVRSSMYAIWLGHDKGVVPYDNIWQLVLCNVTIVSVHSKNITRVPMSPGDLCVVNRTRLFEPNLSAEIKHTASFPVCAMFVAYDRVYNDFCIVLYNTPGGTAGLVSALAVNVTAV